MDIYNGIFDFNKYRAFYAVSEVKSFSKAAELLHISQPAISYSIKELEEQLDTKLFIRDKKNIVLTEDGEKLKYYIKKSFNELITAYRVLKEEEDNLIGEIKIGVYSHVGVFFLPKLIKQFTELHPEIKFTIFSSTTEEMLNKFKNGELDILILHYPIFKNDDYEEKILFNCKSCFFAIKKYYDLFINNNSKNIISYPLLLQMKGFITSNQLEKLFKDHNIILNSKIYLYTTEMTVALAKEGIGIGWGLKKSIEHELKAGKLYEIPFQIDLPTLTFSVGYNKNRVSTSTKAFIEFMLEKSKEF